MAYTTGILKNRIEVLNRTAPVAGAHGIDSGGITWESAGTFWASVEWQKGKAPMSVGALDAYGVVLVRMRWHCAVKMRSRIVHEGQTYQILPETFHADRQANTIQFLAQVIINEQ